MYIALANHGARSRLARLAMYAYLAAVRGDDGTGPHADAGGGAPMPFCRSDGILTEAGKPTAHMQLVHQVGFS